jgi:hypothetical protein
VDRSVAVINASLLTSTVVPMASIIAQKQGWSVFLVLLDRPAMTTLVMWLLGPAVKVAVLVLFTFQVVQE